MTQLSVFELERLRNIERNNVIMEGMGIPGLVPHELRARASSSGAVARRRKHAAPPAEEDTRERRRSSRLANAPAVVFTTFEEDEDLGDSRAKRSKKASTRPAEADDGEVRTALVRATRLSSNPQLRGALCASACSQQSARLGCRGAERCRRRRWLLPRASPRRGCLAPPPQRAAARPCTLE